MVRITELRHQKVSLAARVRALARGAKGGPGDGDAAQPEKVPPVALLERQAAFILKYEESLCAVAATGNDSPRALQVRLVRGPF